VTAQRTPALKIPGSMSTYQRGTWWTDMHLFKHITGYEIVMSIFACSQT
jgi:hypothetical protein